MIWFSSDHHFFHEAVLHFCDRPFKNLDHMHEELIKRHNSRVKPEDTCIFVGDFSFGTGEQTKNVLSRMNGIKFLVQGNHDKKTTLNKFNVTVMELKMLIAGKMVYVKHYPLKWKRFSHFKERLIRWFRNTPDPRYLKRHPVDKGQYHIHGHTHYKGKFNENQIHVGVDAWDYYPVSLKQVSVYIQRREAKRKKK